MTVNSKITKVVSLLFIASLTAYSAPVESPLRVRMNTNLIKNIFHKNDQEFFNILKDMELQDYLVTDGVTLKNNKVSILNPRGQDADYDFNISLDPENFLGIEASDLSFKGKGNIEQANDGKDTFEFEGPIKKFRLSFDV